MTDHGETSVSPHLRSIDLTPFRGRQVLGEPHDLLLSAALRVDLRPSGDGLMSFKGVWPQHEADALRRAMTRVEGERLDDRRTEEQRNGERLAAVLLRVLESAGPTKQML